MKFDSSAILLALFSFGPIVFAFNQSETFLSPDFHLIVKIIPVGPKGYETYESILEIRKANGSLLYRTSYKSKDGQHGEGISHAAWTNDSNFFVFNTFSSGGHQPWHYATYYYSRKENRVQRLDDLIGPIVDDFVIEFPDIVKTKVLNKNGHEQNNGVRVSIKLTNIRK